MAIPRRWPQTPCTFRLGEPNTTSRFLAPYVARRVRRTSSLPRSSLREIFRPPRSTSPGPAVTPSCLRTTPVRAQGPSVGFDSTFAFTSIERSTSRSLSRSRESTPAPVRPASSRLHRRHTAGAPCLATSPRLGLPRGSPRRFEEDARIQLLQPTRSDYRVPDEPLDSRPRPLSCGATASCAARLSSGCPWRRRTTRFDPRNSTPGRVAFDDAPQLRPIDLALLAELSLPKRRPRFGGFLAAALSTVNEAGDEDL